MSDKICYVVLSEGCHSMIRSSGRPDFSVESSDSPVTAASSRWLQYAARPGVLFRRWRRTQPARRRALHCGSKNTIDARLITPAVGPEPIQHVRVKPDGQLLFHRGPCFRRLRKERLVKRRNVRIVDIGVFHAVNPRQVALDRFFVHVDLPFSWR